MQEQAEHAERKIRTAYKYLKSANYFDNKVITGLGYGSFLKNLDGLPEESALEIAWARKQEADAIYYKNTNKAYRLWLESVLIYIESVKEKNVEIEIEEISIFTDSIIKFIEPGQIIPLRIFTTVKLSLDFESAQIMKEMQKVNLLVQSAYFSKVVIVPYTHLPMYIKESVNSIYYN